MTGTMEITTKMGCSVNCKFCPQNLLLKKYYEKENRPTVMELELYKTCIDKIPSDIVIDFSGMCEPWLNPNCTDMVEYAVQAGHEVRIYTTLMGVKESDIERLSKIQIKQFVLHIPDKNENSHIRTDENYLVVLKKLMNTQINGPKSLSCHGEVAEIVDSILDYESWGKNEECDKLIDRAGNVQNDEVTHRHVVGQIACSECGFELNHNVLLPDGTVLLCCMDYGMEHVLGNLYEDTYESLFFGTEANRIKESMNQNDGNILCRSCSNAVSNREVVRNYLKSKDDVSQLWKARWWLQDQLRNMKREQEGLQNWCDELQKGKNWLENQYESIKTEYDKLKAWNGELQEGKQWLENQYEDIKAEYEKLQKWCDELQRGKDWIENEWKNKCNECEELKETIQDR